MTNYTPIRAARAALWAAAASTSVIAWSAHAQGRDAAADTPRSEDEIVVTARKSSERIQDVPVSITAISGETLRKQGANELQDVLRNVPGLSNQNAERGLSRYTIRGLSTYASSPTTGIYLDDVSLATISTTFSGGFDPVFFDMQRIEVLKGPQGTLYGGSAMGGAIKYVSNRPDLNRFSVDAAAGVAYVEHGSPNYNGELVVNAPIVEGSLAFRGGFYYRHDGGYTDAVPGLLQNSSRSSQAAPVYVPLQRDALSTRRAKDINFGNTYALRAALEWQPDDSWSIRPQIFYQDFKLADNGHFFINRPAFQAAHRFAQPNYDTGAIYSLNVEKSFGGVRLTSLTSRFDRTFDYVRDYSFFIGGLVPSLFSFNSFNRSTSNTSTFSQEVRLASEGGPDARLKWIIGGYYLNQDDNLWQAVDTPGVAGIFGTERLYFGDTTTKTKQYAAFGEASLAVIDGLEVTAGVRLFKIDQRIDALYSGPLAGVGGGRISGRQSEEKGVNPKFGLSYKMARDNLVFASAAKGFRPGGANRYAINPTVCGAALAALGRTGAPDEFASDNLWTYEVGTKNQFGGGRMTLNAAAYLTKWNDIQQSIGLSCGFGFTDNIGKAEIRGFEVEARIEPVDGFEIGGTAAYTDTEVTQAGPGTGAVKGQGLPNVPKWMATAYAGYSTELSSGVRFDLRGEYQYQSRALWSINPTRTITYANGVVSTGPNPSQYREAYDVVNAFASISTGDTTVRLYARNLFDVRPYLDLDLTTGVDRALTIRPRTIGVELRQGF
jgi:outer membrane receptor protein involved in Fe transport